MQSKINIIHIAEDISPVSGGVATVVKMLTSELKNDLINHEVVCNFASDASLPKHVKIKKFNPSKYDLGWGYSHQLNEYLRKKSLEPETIFHIHGVWKFIHYFAARLASQNNTPSLITLHGMMDPFLWNKQGLFKKIKKDLYWKITSKTFNKLKKVHAITNSEAENLKNRFSNMNITLIPNSMKIENNDVATIDDGAEKYFLFIGRIAMQKGLDILIKSYVASYLDTRFKLKIIGPIEDINLWNKIKKVINQHESIEYLGTKFGKEKDDLISNAWACVVSSRMEAIGMVNLEAANLRCPSITTYQTGLHDWEEGGGILIDAESVNSCKQALIDSSCWTLEERITRGQKSYNLVKKRYNIAVTNNLWLSLYSSLKNKR